MSEETKNQIPYVPFATFNNALNALHTIPPKLNKAVWHTYAGSVQNQLWSAFRFFSLVGEDGTPTSALTPLVREKERRAELLAALLKEHFPSLAVLDLSAITQQHFQEEMRKFKLGAETTKKASSFYLQAAKAAGIALSPYLLKTTRTPGAKRQKKPVSAKSTPKPALPNNDEALDESVNMVSPGVKKVCYLDNDALLTLTIDRNFGELPSKQRRFVNDLIDMIENFDEKSRAEDEAAWDARQQKVS